MSSHNEERDGSVKRFFATDEYLRNRAPIELRARLVRELVGPLQGRSMVDLGCGDGSISFPFAGEGRLTLVDFVPEMLDRARERAPRGSEIELVNASFTAYEPRRTFDVVLCVGLLAHLKSLSDAVARLAAFVSPGGSCVVQLTDLDNPIGRALFAYRGLRVRLAADDYGLLRTSRRETIALFHAAGFDPCGERRFWPVLPGMGRLPEGLRARYLERMARHPLGAEVILAFVRR